MFNPFSKNKKISDVIELFVVVLIIAIVLAITLPAVHRAKIFVDQLVAAKTLKTLSDGLEMYRNDKGDYPDSISELILATPPYVNNKIVVEANSRNKKSYNGYYFDYMRLGSNRYSYIASPALYRDKNSKQFIVTESGQLRELAVP